jgi:multiple sugar transport system ATP-binding protein
MRVELSRLHKELKTTMIYVTHDQVEAMTLAHRIVVLNRGAIEQVGTPMELYHTPVNRFVAGFIGSPKMNFIEGELVSATPMLATVRLHEGTMVQIASDATSLTAGAKVTLGVRPEHVRASREPLDNAVKGHVQLAEHLGDTIYLHVILTGATETFTVRTEPDNPLDTGDMANLAFPPKRCFLFNEQGKTLPQAA